MTYSVLPGLEGYNVAMKSCNDCGVTMPVTAFPKHISHKDGHDNRCGICIKRQKKEKYLIKKYAPPKPKHCELCNKETENLVIDHCHDSKKFRGWLCNFCNVGLGQLGDTIENLEKAVAYLKKSERKNG